jgi:ERCC4-type nuclease
MAARAAAPESPPPGAPPPPATIAVDTNAGEAGLHAALVQRFGESTVERRRLDVGDVVLTGGDSGAVVLIERKTWADLAKSLTDGRYAEQKARLLSCVAAGCGARAEEGDASEASGEEAEAAGAARMPTRAVYIVEGALKGWAGAVGGAMGGLSKMKNARLEAAIVMTACRDGVPVLRAKDAAHTAELVGYLYSKLCEGALDGGGGGGAGGGGGYASLLKKRKRDNLSNETTWQVMLAQVPGMSPAKAAAVAARYPSLSALAAATEKELAGVLVPSSAPSTAAATGGGGGAVATGATHSADHSHHNHHSHGKPARRLGPAVAKRLAALA